MKHYLIYSILFLGLLGQDIRSGSTYDLQGKVTDDTGMPIQGAVVSIRGTKKSTLTSASGEFILPAVTGNETLLVTALGYIAVEMNIAKGNRLNIHLRPEKQLLQEVVVTAAAAPALYGSRAAGLQVNAAPGTVNSVRVRGVTSITANGAYRGEKKRRNEDKAFNTEGYDVLMENPFFKAKENPLSTFSIDVDAASYSNIRRFLNQGQLPPAGAVRIEEMINYFSYDYSEPTNDAPFNLELEASGCPWNNKHKLVLVGMQGRRIPNESLPPANLVFLIDVSGSMQSPDKLPLVQQSMKLLVDQLRPQDKVAIVVYAGNAGLVLPSTNGDNKIRIKSAIDQLEAGGSTAGGEGIKLAYKTAKQHFLKEGNNRVILCTDGDFNVGVSSDDALVKLIEEERRSGVYLTILGYGMGNYQDAKMQKLADKGNGNHAYIDNLSEAKKVLVKEAGGTLYTIAKDVKLQVEFNPQKVQGYRLIGYENRVLAREDFNDDTKDAGELGSGHTVTALYEIIPVGVKAPELRKTDSLRYQSEAEIFSESPFTDELMYVKIRYKKPGQEHSRLLEFPVDGNSSSPGKTSDNFRFAAAVASLGMLLIDSKYKGDADFDLVLELAERSRGRDKEGYRKEFSELVRKAASLKEGL